MTDFKQYTKDDAAVQAFAAIWPEKDLLNGENLDAIFGSVIDLRAKRANGMNADEMTNGVIDGDVEIEAWTKFIVALDEEIASFKETEKANETNENAPEEKAPRIINGVCEFHGTNDCEHIKASETSEPEVAPEEKTEETGEQVA